MPYRKLKARSPDLESWTVESHSKKRQAVNSLSPREVLLADRFEYHAKGCRNAPVLSKLRQHLTPPTPLSSCSLQIAASGAILLGINMTVQDIAPASCLYNVGRGWRLLD